MRTRFFPLLLISGFLCGAAHAAPPQWVDVRSAHFTVITDSNEKQGRHVLDQFERMRWLFQSLFPRFNVDPVSPVVVIATKNEKTFASLEPAAYLKSGQLKLAGLFSRTPDKNYVLLRLDADGDHPYATIYHEFTHMEFAGGGDWLPLWLNEGFAEFIQNTEIRDKDVLVGEANADDILYLRQSRPIPLDVLFRVDQHSPYYHEEERGSVFYAESWALTHYLFILDRQKGTNHLADYVALMSHHEDPVAAAQKSFGDLKQLQSALDTYIQRSVYMHLLLSSAAAPLDESAYKVTNLTEPQWDAARADFEAYVGRTDEARALLDAVLKADPGEIEAHETMGFLELLAGHRDLARKWYGEAVKLGSQNYLAHYYYSNLLLSQGGLSDAEDAEAGLRAAIRLNPRFAEAYVSLANLLVSVRKDTEAVAVLKDLALKTENPAAAARAQHEAERIEQRAAARAQAESEEKARAEARAKEEKVAEKTAEQESAPRHPTEPATGPKHEVLGTIRGVTCSYPSVIEFSVQNAQKTVSLYSNNYFKLDFSVLGFTPSGSLNPCRGMEGMKARVRYAESSDKTVDGQAIAIELRK